MEDNIDRDMAVFHQVCDVNHLDPETITAAAKERFPDRFSTNADVEKLIWTALDYRATSLIRDTGHTLRNTNMAYSIDGDPAAPAFVVNEDNIRSQCDAETAQEVIDALDKVQLPVQP